MSFHGERDAEIGGSGRQSYNLTGTVSGPEDGGVWANSGSTELKRCTGIFSAIPSKEEVKS